MTVAQAPAGYLADRVGSRPVMWASWVLGTIAAAVMAMAGSLPVFVAGLLTYGLTSLCGRADEQLHHQRAGELGAWNAR